MFEVILRTTPVPDVSCVAEVGWLGGMSNVSSLVQLQDDPHALQNKRQGTPHYWADSENNDSFVHKS